MAGSPQSLFVGQHSRDLPGVDVSDRRRPAQAPLPLPRLAAEDVLLARLAPQKLAVLGPLEALGRAAVCLEFELFRHVRGYLAGVAAGFVRPPVCGRRLRIVCICCPSSRGMVSATAPSTSSSTSRSRMRRPIS